jgi:enoyl-CoA hydratase/carnithine racemase
MEERVRTSEDGSVLVVRFARGEKRNALTPSMIDGAREAIERTGAGVRAIVLSGEGPAFCAGFDLSACKDDAGLLGTLLSGLAAFVGAMRDCPRPVVVSAHGAAIAGGCALLAGADAVVTDRSARLGYPVVRLGISPAVSGPMLRLATGDGPARARLLDSGLIDGAAAVRVGLAHECVDRADACEARALAIARELADKPAHALSATKRWLNAVDGSDARASRDEALRASLALLDGAEGRALLAAVWGGGTERDSHGRAERQSPKRE